MKEIITGNRWRMKPVFIKHVWHALAATSINVTLLLIFSTPVFAAKNLVVKIGVEDTRIYRVSYEELGLSTPIRSKYVAMTNRGEPVAVLLNDGDDGWFGPSDTLSFIGEHLKGDQSYFNEFSRYNVYRFEKNRRNARRLQQFQSAELGEQAPIPVRTQYHLERDKLRARFNPLPPSSEVWFWEKISQIDKKPFSQRLDLGAEPGNVSIKVAMQGWSRPIATSTKDLSDHHVDLYLDGELIDDEEFQSQESGLFEVLIPDMAGGEHTIELRIPRRRATDQKNDIVDVVLLNYIEVEFDHTPDPASPASFYTMHSASQVEIPSGSILVGNGQYLYAETSTVVVLPANTSWHQIPDNGYGVVAWVEPDQPSRLMSKRNRADYLIISHASLIEAVQPLAEFHRSRGLDVKVIDAADIYDEFNDGIVSAYAIRDFISHAYHKWRGRPEYVLLVGDSSWDVHNEEANDQYYADHAYKGKAVKFPKIPSTSYADTGKRNLIPTFSVGTNDGLAASDNLFVAVDGDDFKPDLAIGRFPVVKPEEVSAIVDKLISYASLSGVGPWRRNILWITNEQKGLQRISDKLAIKTEGTGFSANKIYPRAEEKDNVENQARLIQAINEGQLLVHFIGHGGRYIWRTGPPDYRKNHDLFTLDHVDQLSPNINLPMILSMTCYSAPFDHPTADSIGEKFLRLPDRGAIAVFAASWRNSPGRNFSQLLVENLTEKGVSIGKAIMLAKQEERSRIMVETYNLLGDPATKLATPGSDIELTKREGEDRYFLSGSIATDTGGRLIVDWLDADGKILQTEETENTSGKFESSLSKAGVTPHLASVYFWNTETGVDAFGSIRFQPVAEETKRSSMSPAERRKKRKERQEARAKSG